MRRLILLILVFSSHYGFAIIRNDQNTSTSPAASDTIMIWDKLNIDCDPRIHELIRQQADLNKHGGTTSGYRLQIYFGSGNTAHTQAMKAKTEFLSVYPDVKTYLFFKSPDFIVRVGNFRSKSEALKMQKSLLGRFPNAFIVADEIAFPDLITPNTN